MDTEPRENTTEEILPSEKAFAYKMELDAKRRRAGRPLKNGEQLVLNYLWVCRISFFEHPVPFYKRTPSQMVAFLLL